MGTRKIWLTRKLKQGEAFRLICGKFDFPASGSANTIDHDKLMTRSSYARWTKALINAINAALNTMQMK